MLDNVMQKKMQEFAGIISGDPNLDLTGLVGNDDIDKEAELLEQGAFLPSYADINEAHKVFIDALDDTHPKAVEMLMAAEKLKEIAILLRKDRDAQQPIHDNIAAVLGCAYELSQATNKKESAAQRKVVQKHFNTLLDFLADLSAVHMTYSLEAMESLRGQKLK